VIFGWPTDWWSTLGCAFIFVVTTASSLRRDRGPAMGKGIGVFAAVFVLVLLVVPAPWNLPAYVASLVATVVLIFRWRGGGLDEAAISVVDRPAVPADVARVIADYEALGFGAPVFLEFVVRGSSAYWADLRHPTATMRARVAFATTLHRPQIVWVASRFAVGSLVTVDRGPRVESDDEASQMLDGGTPEELLRAHEVALAAIAERGLRPELLDEVPDVEKLQADLRRQAEEDGISPLRRSWRVAMASRQSPMRVSNPIPPIRSPHDRRVRKLVALQSTDR